MHISKLNSEGYSDPTAYEALKPMIKEEAAIQSKASELIAALRSVAHSAGFDLVGGVVVRHRRSGKGFKG